MVCGGSVVVLGDPHSCRNRRAARGSRAPGEDPGQAFEPSLRRAGECVSEAGARRRSRVHQWRSPSHPTRQPRVGRRGLVGGRRFGRGKRRHWLVVCGKRPWFRPNSDSQVGFGQRAARQEASEGWSTPSCVAEQAAREGSRLVQGHGPDLGGSARASAGASGAKRCATRAGVPPWLLRNQRERRAYPRWKSSQRNGATAATVNGEARASRSRAWVPLGARDN